MAELAAAVLELSTLALRSSKIIHEFAKEIRGQHARCTELADKIEKLSLVVKNTTDVIDLLKTSNDPGLIIPLKLLKNAITDCQQGMQHVTEYFGRLQITLQKSMFDRFFHECRHELSGKVALKKALQDIEGRESDMNGAIIRATLYVTVRLGQRPHQVDPPPYPKSLINGAFGLSSSADDTSKENRSSSQSEVTGDTSLGSKAPASQEGEHIETELSERLIRAIKIKARPCVRDMIKNGTQILLKDHEHEGCCALHHAIMAGDKGILRELLGSEELQVNPTGIDTGDRQGTTALHYAAKAGDVKLAIKLIEARANIDITNKHGRSVLYMALEADRDEFVEMLLERGVTDLKLPAKLKERLREMKTTVECHQRRKEKTARKMQGNKLKVSLRG